MGIARKSKYDGVPYTTLLYATGGPDSVQMEITNDGKIKRKDPTNEDTTQYTYIQQAAIRSDENAHSGSDVSNSNFRKQRISWNVIGFLFKFYRSLFMLLDQCHILFNVFMNNHMLHI